MDRTKLGLDTDRLGEHIVSELLLNGYAANAASLKQISVSNGKDQETSTDLSTDRGTRPASATVENCRHETLQRRAAKI